MWLFGRKKKKAKEEAERKAREEAEAKRLEEEKLEKERIAKEEAEAKAKEEAERKAKEEAEAKAKEEAETKEATSEKESTQEIKVTKTAGKKIYHVVKRPKDNKWCVKIEGSDRAIKLFDTKPEALAYSEKLAANQDGTLRVHASKGKNKGKIQANK